MDFNFTLGNLIPEGFVFKNPVPNIHILEALTNDLILSKVFGLLDGRDLKNCRLVSKVWDANASRLLWKKTEIRVRLLETEEEDIPAAFNCNHLRIRALSAFRISKVLDRNDLLGLMENRVSSSSNSLLGLRLYCLSYKDMNDYIFSTEVQNFMGALTLDIRSSWTLELLKTVSLLPMLKKLKVFIVDSFSPHLCGEDSQNEKIRTSNKLESIQLTVTAVEEMEKFVGVFIPACKKLNAFTYLGPSNTNLMLLEYLEMNYMGPGLMVFECKQSGSFYSPADVVTYEDVILGRLFDTATYLNLRNLPPLSFAKWQQILRVKPWYGLQTLEISIQRACCGSESAETLRGLDPPHLYFPTLFRDKTCMVGFYKLSRVVLSSNLNQTLEVWEKRYGTWYLLEASIVLTHGENIPYLRRHKMLKTLRLRIPELTPEEMQVGLEGLPEYLNDLCIDTCCTERRWFHDCHFITDKSFLCLPLNLKVLDINVDCSDLTNNAVRFGFLKLQYLKELRLTGMPSKFTNESERKLVKKLANYDIRTCENSGARMHW